MELGSDRHGLVWGLDQTRTGGCGVAGASQFECADTLMGTSGEIGCCRRKNKFGF